MMVEEHIHNLLFEHDCVIIPDFGGLITHYASARVHPIKHTFSPPSKHIAFNEKLKLNDGLLLSTFAYNYKIPAEEAQAQVTHYVQQLQEALRTRHQYEMKGVGVFRFNQEQKIQFEYIPADNLFSHSFGLPELISRPVPLPDVAEGLRTFIKEKKNAPAAVPQKTWGRRLRRVYDSVAILGIAGLSITALYFISIQKDYSLSSLNPFTVLDLASAQDLNRVEGDAYEADFYDSNFETNVAAAENLSVTTPKVAEMPVPLTALPTSDLNTPGEETETAAPVTALATVITPAPAVSAPAKAISVKNITAPGAATGTKMPTTIKAKTERYYVIAGGYSTLKNAEYSRKVANRHGAQGKIILPFTGSKLYRVSIADFNNRDEALAYLPQLKNKYGKNIWILNY